MKLPYVVTAWAETHSRATYPITDPRIILFKQHLSFLLALCLQEDGINKPMRIQIINHYLDPLPAFCVRWQRLQITKFVYDFAWLFMVWFSCAQPDVVHITGANCSFSFKDFVYEWLPERSCVVVNSDAVYLLIKEGKYQPNNHQTTLQSNHKYTTGQMAHMSAEQMLKLSFSVFMLVNNLSKVTD